MVRETNADRRQLTLVIPAFNEEAGIQRAIAEAREALVDLDYDHEILVVDDGSSDATIERAQELATIWPGVRVLRHPVNRGYGAALRTGFAAARMPLVAFTDADCQFHLEDLERLVPETDLAPIVVGFRIDRQDPWRRRFLSWGYNRVVRWLFDTGVRDCDCALKVFHREIVQDLLPNSDGFFVNTEMLARARRRGLEIREVGVRHRPRREGASKVSLWDVPKTLQTLVPFWWQLRAQPQAEPARPVPTLALSRRDRLKKLARKSVVS